MEIEKAGSINASDLHKLAEKRIYFGHQSVGYNVIDGIRDILKDYPDVNITIAETDKPSEYHKGVFGHSRIGKNTDPISKIDDFVKKINSGLGNVVDSAFFKLCYVDITSKTDIQKVFSYYKVQMDKLEKKYPSVLFLHVTVPLKTNDPVPQGKKQKIKYFIKTVLGMETGKNENQADNIVRNRFNELLKNNYKNVIDLAGFESVSADGKECVFSVDGKQYRQLVGDYTCDGGHLNETGRRTVAIKFLSFLFKQ